MALVAAHFFVYINKTDVLNKIIIQLHKEEKSMSVLDAMFNGDKFLSESINFNNFREYRELGYKTAEFEKKFLNKLSDDEISMYETLKEMNSALADMETQTTLKAAFALGVRLMSEVHNSDLFDFGD